MNGTIQGAPVAAIATAPGPAGIAVVRLSGEGALEIADKLCAGSRTLPSARPGGTFGLCRLRDPATGEFLDEALVLVFRAPHSYTGEDAAEFQVHGGRAAPRRVLAALL
ncbi:MAG: tRNA uridine-5-carboxymethylaminomethyl(34) synthesis GTPase MnmE, partial [Kiritimatiellae bacterium]|nr:tRNA uridine-5-carboxymethylaminomethyl(34) synthesis GTPase MnmE [Kiritimatiellia bacterium]